MAWAAYWRETRAGTRSHGQDRWRRPSPSLGRRSRSRTGIPTARSRWSRRRCTRRARPGRPVVGHRAGHDAARNGPTSLRRRRRSSEPPAQAGTRVGTHRLPVRRLCDYGAFRDLQRHRPLTIEWQRLTTEHGSEVPAAIDDAGLRADWDEVMVASARMERELLDAGLEETAQYAVAMAYRIRFVMQMNAREAMHLTELRSQPQGHPTYRRVAQRMHRADRRRASGAGRGVHVRQPRGRRPRAPGRGTPNRGQAKRAELTYQPCVHSPVVSTSE